MTDRRPAYVSQAHIHLDHLTHNMRLLTDVAGGRPLFPAIKANAYGHGAEIVARHLVGLGYDTLCVAHAPEAVALTEAGVRATFLVMSAALPEHAEAMVAHGFEPAVCTVEMLEALVAAAVRSGRRVSVHVKVDTGMGRVGVHPDNLADFLDRCRALPAVRVRGLMSHFATADERDKTFAHEQVVLFHRAVAVAAPHGIEVVHMANSAGILDVPEALFDAARPGIAIYGLAPSAEMANPRVAELRPVLEWKTRITLLKQVPAGTGLSYGLTFRTERPSLIATLPMGYGDGFNRRLGNRGRVLVGGRRCPIVGRVTMDQCLIDVTELGDRVALGDEVVLIGRQDGECITAEELAERLDTINYEVVTAISNRVSRVAVEED